ncbi:hypothetical protein VNI00_010548 [Paramarasmius palmivorus]|uniref:F-box protein n=1 Tax=Paramarasmius palmivorus TaxID=297713 RepID=A0AAW0CM85_9AGAR
MSSITIEPRNLDVCQRYITTLVECKTRPPVRRVVFDVAVAMWEVLYYLDKSCSEENTLSLVITSSVRFADWRTLSSIFIKHLIAKLPRVKSLHLKSLECRFQFSLLSAYMSTLVKLTLHSAIARSSAGWTPISFPHLEHIELIQDHSIMLHEDSLPMLMAKYVDAPKLKTGHVACAVEGHIFSVYEFLYAFAETLEEVKVIGDFIYEALDQRLLPRLPALTCLHVEIELVHNIFKFGDTATEYIPRLQRLVMEGDWATMETGSYDVRWADMHRMLTRLMDIYPKPVIVCGYRGAEVRQRNIFARILIHHLLETVGWDIRDIFEVEESRCNPCLLVALPLLMVNLG